MKGQLNRKWVLDAGCGAGPFLDAAAESGGEIVGIDISCAIDAAKEKLEGRGNVHFVPANINGLPFREGAFDPCYRIDVIQDTPDTADSLRSIARMVKPGGEGSVTFYPRKPWTKLFSNYWYRPVIKRLKRETLLRLIERILPATFPAMDVLFRMPLLDRAFMFVIPKNGLSLVGKRTLNG